MTPMISFFIAAIIVGFVTAGLKIQFDRFFAIILLVFLMGVSISHAINIFLWVVFLGAGSVLLKNREKIKGIPAQNKKKFLTVIPLLAFTGAYFGSFLFASVSAEALLFTVGVLALLYGLRLSLVHFKSHEFEYKNERPMYQKACGLAGPVVSGFFAGFVGTTFKSLKIPFAVRIGRMNLAQVYLGNTITAFYASFFAILLHMFFFEKNSMAAGDVLLGIGLWAAIHFSYEITNAFFKDQWRKPFQIFIGLVLILVAFRFF